MKNNRFLIYTRVFVLTFLVALPFFFLLFLTYGGMHIVGDLYLFFKIVSVPAAICIMREDICPEMRTSWIFFLLIFPVITIFVFLFVGKTAATYRLMKMKRSKSRSCLKLQSTSSLVNTDAPILPADKYPIYRSEAVYYTCGEDAFAALCSALLLAKREIYVEYYIISPGVMWDKMLSILKSKAEEGVRVFVVYDDIGSLLTLSVNTPFMLKEYGIECMPYSRASVLLSPELHMRDHRKLAAIDGRVMLVGGVNVSDEYINKRRYAPLWKDSAVLLNVGEGESLIQPFSTEHPTDSSSVKDALLQMIYSSTRLLWIMTPYLIPDYETVSALVRAKRRGVDVRIITPHIPDKGYVHALTRSHYAPLLSEGVSIYEYEKGFIHSKVILSDNSRAMVGSVNLDYRSMYLTSECGVIMYSDSLDSIRDDFENTFSKCIKIGKKGYMSACERIIAFVLRPFEPLM